MNTSVSSKSRAEYAVGDTPLIQLEFKEERISLFAKCEYQNPSGSIKDRFVHAVITEGEQRRQLDPNSILLEYSSGSTGVALAMAGAARGYKVRIVVSEACNGSQRLKIEELGAEIVTFAGSARWKGIKLTREMASRDPNIFLTRQFENELNAASHERGTGSEILRQLGGPIDALVAGYGTGGTLAGVSRALRRLHPGMQVYLMEFSEQATSLSEGFRIQQASNSGGSYVPPLLVGTRHGGVIRVPYAEAVDMAQHLYWEFGLAVGIFSGANVVASLQVAKRLGPKARVVTFLCDNSEKFLNIPSPNRTDLLPSIPLEAFGLKMQGTC